jgi:hypothetical protein
MRPPLSSVSLVTRLNSASYHSILQILFNNILHLLLSLRSGLFYSEFPTKIVCALLLHQCNMARTPHHHVLCLIIFGEKYKKRIPSYTIFYYSLSLPNVHTFSGTPFSYIPSIHFSLSHGDTLSKFHTNMTHAVQLYFCSEPLIKILLHRRF